MATPGSNVSGLTAEEDEGDYDFDPKLGTPNAVHHRRQLEAEQILQLQQDEANKRDRIDFSFQDETKEEPRAETQTVIGDDELVDKGSSEDDDIDEQTGGSAGAGGSEAVDDDLDLDGKIESKGNCQTYYESEKNNICRIVGLEILGN